MNRVIRIILGGIFVLFLFIPIAQCSYSPCKEYGPELEAEESQCIETEQATKEISVYGENEDFILFLVFIVSIVLPIGVGLVSTKNRNKALILNTIELIGSTWLTILVFGVVYWVYQPLLLGHIFFMLAMLYVCWSLYSLYGNIKKP